MLRWLQRFSNDEKVFSQVGAAILIVKTAKACRVGSWGSKGIQAFEFTNQLAWN